jgi:predicted ArsR family transcriptional regulator
MDKATQKAKILAYCYKYGSITVREASVKLDINSPTKRISEMRKSDKYEVRSINETRIKEGGKVVRYKRYFIFDVERERRSNG